MVQARQRRNFPVDQVLMIQRDPRHAFLPAGTNEEIEIALDRWRPVVSEAGTKLAALGLCVRSGSESRDRTPEEHVACDIPQEGG